LSTFVSHSLSSMHFRTSCEGQLAISHQRNRMHLTLEQTSEKVSISETPETMLVGAVDAQCPVEEVVVERSGSVGKSLSLRN
jgi:hypothetical protein